MTGHQKWDCFFPLGFQWMCLTIVYSFPCQNYVLVAAMFKLPIAPYWVHFPRFLPVIMVCAFGGLPKLNSSLVNKVMLCVSKPETAVGDNRRIVCRPVWSVMLDLCVYILILQHVLHLILMKSMSLIFWSLFNDSWWKNSKSFWSGTRRPWMPQTLPGDHQWHHAIEGSETGELHCIFSLEWITCLLTII